MLRFEHKKLRNMRFPAHVRFHESLLIFPLTSVLAQSYFCGVHLKLFVNRKVFQLHVKAFIFFRQLFSLHNYRENHNCTELKTLPDCLLFFFDN